MKENKTAMHRKKSSITDDRKTSVAKNPFLLLEFDEENYDSSAEPVSSVDEIPETSLTAPVPPNQSRSGGVTFKKVAKAITKQRKWSTVLKVSCKSRRLNQTSPYQDWRMQIFFNWAEANKEFIYRINAIRQLWFHLNTFFCLFL